MPQSLTQSNLCQRIVLRGIVAVACLFGSLGFTAAHTQNRETLTPGRSVEREMSGGEVHRYDLALETGQYCRIVAEQHGIDVVVTILGQDDNPLVEVDRPNSSYGPETISFIASASGQYRLQVRSYEKTTIQGRYRITLKEMRATTPGDEKHLAAERAVTEAEQLRARNTAEFWRQAVAKFEQARALWQELGEPYEEAIALYGLGLSYRSLSENQSGVNAFSRALELMRAADDRYGAAIVQAGAGWSYLYLGELDQALESFTESLQLRQGLMNPSGEGLARYGIGWVHALRDEDQLALESFERALQLRQAARDRRGEAITRIGLAKIYSRLGRHEEARETILRALAVLREFGDRNGEADALSQLGWINLSLNQIAAAEQSFQTALRLRQAVGDRTGEATTHFGLARVARQQGKLAEAQAQIESALAIIESLRAKGSDQRLRTSYFAQVQDYYDFYIDLLMRLDERDPRAGHAAAALYASERARARSLLDLLTQADAPDSATPAQPLSAAEIEQQLLDDNTVLLEYALGAERSYLWSVTPAGITSHQLPGRAEIEAAAQRVITLLTARNQHLPGENAVQRRTRIAQADAQYPAAAVELSRMLLGPVAGQLGAKRLLIVPHGALQFVPFAALPAPQPEDSTAKRRERAARAGRSSSDAADRPLMAEHEIVMLPSASTLAAIRQRLATRKPAPRSFAVIADPVFTADDERVRSDAKESRSLPRQQSSHDFVRAFSEEGGPVIAPRMSRLSTTRWEAQQIAALAGDSRLALDFAANRATVTDPSLGQYRIIHFATHAIINHQRPDLSAIVLSQVDEQGRAQDGLLRAHELYQLKLPAELVVLSACRTGLGKDVRGEGLMSLTRGFLSAGAARVLVSLWELNDQATAEVMARFYRKMLGPARMPAAAALRATQKEMWREQRWRQAYFWGAFVVQGEWK